MLDKLMNGMGKGRGTKWSRSSISRVASMGSLAQQENVQIRTRKGTKRDRELLLMLYFTTRFPM